MSKISVTVGTLEGLTQENALLAVGATATAERLGHQARLLNDAVSVFALPPQGDSAPRPTLG